MTPSSTQRSATLSRQNVTIVIEHQVVCEDGTIQLSMQRSAGVCACSWKTKLLILLTLFASAFSFTFICYWWLHKHFQTNPFDLAAHLSKAQTTPSDLGGARKPFGRFPEAELSSTFSGSKCGPDGTFLITASSKTFCAKFKSQPLSFQEANLACMAETKKQPLNFLSVFYGLTNAKIKNLIRHSNETYLIVQNFFLPPRKLKPHYSWFCSEPVDIDPACIKLRINPSKGSVCIAAEPYQCTKRKPYLCIF